MYAKDSGPQGTLFGKNTIGGAVHYTSVKPSFEYGGHIEASLGSMERADVKATINIPSADSTII